MASRRAAGSAEALCGVGAAYDRDPRAMTAFDELPAAAVDGQVQEWRVRAALWKGDYGSGARMDGADASKPFGNAPLALLARSRRGGNQRG